MNPGKPKTQFIQVRFLYSPQTSNTINMKKLLCVNAKIIEYIDPETKEKLNLIPAGLEEGKIYITRGAPFMAEHGCYCYYIEGIGQRLASRFTDLLDDDVEEEVQAEKAIVDIKNELNLN